MNTHLLRPARTATALAIAAVLTACASSPDGNAQLIEARQAYNAAAADAQVVRSAPVEMRQAQTGAAKSRRRRARRRRRL